KLAQQMRANLNGIWRKPDEQAKQKTNRRPEDLQAELLRGYTTARSLLEAARSQSTSDWELALAQAALMFDELEYRQEVAPGPDFAKGRAEVMGEFARAASLYADKVEEIPEESQSDQVYELWFGAALGACDLQRLTEDKQPDPKQASAIRAAILALPGET